MPQFDRSASVVIGVPGGQGKRYAGLRIRFTVERDLKPSPNTAKVEIYNLSEDSRAATGMYSAITDGFCMNDEFNPAMPVVSSSRRFSSLCERRNSQPARRLRAPVRSRPAPR